jgi:hypothetical protein
MARKSPSKDLQQVFSPPGLESVIFSAPFLPSEGSLWIGALNTWKDASLHQAPRRMIQVTTQGEYQITTSEGAFRRFPVGAVLIVEDTSGVDHSSKITSAEDVIIFAVGLPVNVPA